MNLNWTSDYLLQTTEINELTSPIHKGNVGSWLYRVTAVVKGFTS